MKSAISRGRWPKVLEENERAVRASADRLCGEVGGLHCARERISDDQGRRGEIIGAHIRIDAALEIPVARKDGGHHQIIVVDGLRDRFRQRPELPMQVVQP